MNRKISPLEEDFIAFIEEKAKQMKKEINSFIDSQVERIKASQNCMDARSKPITINDERKEYGLDSILAGDVVIIGSTCNKTAGNSMIEGITIDIEVDTTEIDEAIEKANKLAELLREVQQILNSLFGTSRSET